MWWLNDLLVCDLQKLRILTNISFELFVSCQNFQFWLDFLFRGWWMWGWGGGGLLTVNKRPWLGCFTLPRQGIGGGLRSLGSSCSIQTGCMYLQMYIEMECLVNGNVLNNGCNFTRVRIFRCVPMGIIIDAVTCYYSNHIAKTPHFSVSHKFIHILYKDYQFEKYKNVYNYYNWDGHWWT